MELYTLNRDYQKEDTIDELDSVIWTERYYGDGEFELLVPPKASMISKLPKGVFLMCEGSNIPMILETRNIVEGSFKTTGISLTKWLNNRFFRTTNDHSIKEWIIESENPGTLIARLVNDWCISSDYLSGTIPIGLPGPDRERIPLPGLIIGEGSDESGPSVGFALPFGPIFDAIYSIGTTYEVGNKIELVEDHIEFLAYRGQDRTSGQSSNPVIQFSSEMDSFTNITDLESISDYKNLVYTFAVNAPTTYMTEEAGRASSVDESVTGFDLRLHQEFSDFDTAGHDVTAIGNILDDKARPIVAQLKAAQLVDGEIVQNKQINYGQDYFLGDLVECVGNSGVLQKARITEYIRAQDSAGERAYPALTMIDE